jgi:hypothetical protein
VGQDDDVDADAPGRPRFGTPARSTPAKPNPVKPTTYRSSTYRPPEYETGRSPVRAPVDRPPIDRPPTDRIVPVARPPVDRIVPVARAFRTDGIVRRKGVVRVDGVLPIDEPPDRPMIIGGSAGDRVPEDMPFVVRTSGLRFIGYVGGATLAAYVAYGWLLSTVVLVVAADTADSGATGGTAGLLGVVGFLLGVPAVVLQRRCFGHGPLLGADSDEVCARLVGRPGRRSPAVVWLAWNEIDTVYIGRRRFSRVVWLVARGAPELRIAVPTRLADHTADQIIRVLRELSAGRVRVYSGSL